MKSQELPASRSKNRVAERLRRHRAHQRNHPGQQEADFGRSRVSTQEEQEAAPTGAEKAPQDEATEEAPQKHTQAEEATHAELEATPKEEAAQEEAAAAAGGAGADRTDAWSWEWRTFCSEEDLSAEDRDSYREKVPGG